MEEGRPLHHTLYYVVIIGSFFILLFVLDAFLGVHYAPDAQRLNRPETGTNAVADIQPASMVAMEASAEKEEVSAVDEENEAGFFDRSEPAEEVQSYFENLKADYSKNVLSKLPAGKSRTDVTIRYYKHPPDGQSAYALQKLGFYIHERPVEPGYENFQSNAIYYGDSVKVEDIKLVVYTLLKEGLPLKTISPSRFGSNWKARSIEIGADSTLVAEKTLNLAELKQLTIRTDL